jgi:nucleoside-triphosphatase THEP1
MVGIRNGERSQLTSAFEANANHVHIYGEPGIGKSTLVEQTLNGLLPDVADRRITVRETFTPEMVEKEVLEEMRSLLGKIAELQNRTAGWSSSLSIPGIGGFGGGRTTDERERDIHKIQSLSENFKERAILWLDDVQKITDKQSTRRDCIEELSEALPESLTLVTSGRTSLKSADMSIELKPLSAEETANFLRRTFPDLTKETTEGVHEQVDGHPYFLNLLLEAADSPEDLDLPEGDVFSFIEDEYLDALSSEEERFVRQTSLLTELDESICATVVTDMDRATIRQTLDSLRRGAIIRAIDRSDTGERIYSMHDLFQQYLYNRLDNEAELHRRAFQYYVRDAVESTTNPELAPMTNIGAGIFTKHHLHQLYDGEPSVEAVQRELDRLDLTFRERRTVIHGIGFYLFDSPEARAELMNAEATALMEQLRDETDVTEMQSIIIQLYLNSLPAAFGETAEKTPAIVEEEYHQKLIDDVRALDWDDADPEVIRFFEDLVMGASRLAALVTARRVEAGQPEKHKEQLISITERYGLEKEIAWELTSLTQEFFEETLPEFDIDSAIESTLDEIFTDGFNSGSVRKNLQTVQDTALDAMLSLAGKGIEKALSDSEEIFEYCSSVEQALADAENPLFVAFWTRLCGQIYTVLGPNDERADYFETRFERAKERRIEYEETLESPLLEIEEDELLPEEEFAEADADTEFQELVDLE